MNRFGRGYGWYVATNLDHQGVSWVIGQVLARHGLRGRCQDAPDLETTVRVAPDGTRLPFLLNHRAEPVLVSAPGGGTDLLSGEPVACGQEVRLDPYGVMVLRSSAGRKSITSRRGGCPCHLVASR